MVSQMINDTCPWCDKKFDMIGEKLVGLDQTDKCGELVVWFHEACEEQFAKCTDMDLQFDGEKFVKIPRVVKTFYL